jgi:ABC-type antimicrobial peptide transport system permease subunit
LKLTRGTILAICALFILVVLGLTGYNYHNVTLTEHAKTEAILTHKLETLQKANTALLSDHEKLTSKYTLRGDSVKELGHKAAQTTIIYREARTVTDSDSTAENVASELRSARVLINHQETHINGLLALNNAADSLLEVRLQVIDNQSEQIQTLSNMFATSKAQHEEELKQERKIGNKKFFKGMGIGGAIVAILVLL